MGSCRILVKIMIPAHLFQILAWIATRGLSTVRSNSVSNVKRSFRRIKCSLDLGSSSNVWFYNAFKRRCLDSIMDGRTDLSTTRTIERRHCRTLQSDMWEDERLSSSKRTENWVVHEKDREDRHWDFIATYHPSAGHPAQMIHIVRRNYQHDISF